MNSWSKIINIFYKDYLEIPNLKYNQIFKNSWFNIPKHLLEEGKLLSVEQETVALVYTSYNIQSSES